MVQFLDNRHLERGLSSFDQRHNLTTGFQLSSPVGVRGLLRNGGWKTKLLRGWNLQGNFTATTGTPLTAKVSGNLANTGGLAAGGSLRAEATGLPIHAPGDAYFNTLAFTTPAPGQFGNAGRDDDSRAVPHGRELQPEPRFPFRREPADADVSPSTPPTCSIT